MIRQGDVLLVPTDKLPKGLRKKDSIIAVGEITGHNHRFESNQVQVFIDKQNQQFVQVSEPSKLIHEEHHELKIPKGNYKIILQREFDVVERIRQVQD